MAQTGNGMADHRGKIIYSSGKPKDTTLGKDLSRHATNKFATPGPNPEEVSPSATKQSRNQ